jgi:hypothetical protein
MFSRFFISFLGLFVFWFKLFFCGFYSIVLYLHLCHGKASMSLGFSVCGGGIRFYIILFVHLFILYFFFVLFDVLGVMCV